MNTVPARPSTEPAAQDPGLLLVADDRRVPPCAIADGLHTFALEAPVRSLRLLSRSFVPSRQMPGSPDHRRLGVSLWWLRLRTEQATVHIRAEHPLLRDGFHAADNGARWTDGFALVPACFHHLLAGDLTVEVRIGTPDVTYPPQPRDGRPRALVVDETLPMPDRDAGSNVMRDHVRLLQSLGYAVTFLPANLDACEPYASALEDEGVEILAHPNVAGPEQVLALRGDGFALAYLHRVAIAARMLPLLRRLAPQARVLFNPADLHFLRLERQAALLGSAALRAEAEALRPRELQAIAAADATLLCNTTEMALVRAALPEAKLVFLPWVITRRADALADFAARTGIMFLGGFAHPPNADGITWFVTSVMPLLRGLLPGVTLHVYGHAIPEAVAALAAGDVCIEGHAPDLAPVFARHRVAIAPLRFGAGFKGKLAESLAHGVPTVATPMAAEGTGLENGEHLLVAEGAAAFAAAVALLMQTPELWARLARQGRLYASTAFSPARGRESLAQALAMAGLPPITDTA
jgi:hypothetical protein